MCQSKYLSIPPKKARVSKELSRTKAHECCKLRDGAGLAVQNATRRPDQVTQPFQGCIHRLRSPRVARPSQPWALRQNPFGIQRFAALQLSSARPATFLASALIFALLWLSGPSALGVTLAELRADSTLTPERFIKCFADF